VIAVPSSPNVTIPLVPSFVFRRGNMNAQPTAPHPIAASRPP
jgi:hypothetical protein